MAQLIRSHPPPHLVGLQLCVQGNWGNALLAYGGLKKRLLEAVNDAPPPGPMEASAVAASKAQILKEASNALIDAGNTHYNPLLTADVTPLVDPSWPGLLGHSTLPCTQLGPIALLGILEGIVLMVKRGSSLVLSLCSRSWGGVSGLNERGHNTGAWLAA